MERPHLVADIPQKALIEHDGAVLIVRDIVENRWELPGGRVNDDEGDALVQALQRELREELSIEIIVGQLFDVFIFHGSKNHCVLTYICQLVGGAMPLRGDGVEVGELRWVSSASEVMDLPMQEGYKKLLKRYFDERGGK